MRKNHENGRRHTESRYFRQPDRGAREGSGFGASVEVNDPNEASQARELAGADAIIAIGGDGTVRGLARRCLDASGKVPPLLLIPAGTANLMARHLRLRWPWRDLPNRVLQALKGGKVIPIDLGQANGEIFLIMTGVGIDGSIIHEMSKMRKGPINYASYAIPTALAVGKYRFSPLRVCVDGREVFPMLPAVAIVANVAEYGVGFPLAPDSKPDDGLLDICVIPVDTHMEMLKRFLHAAAGEHLLTEGAIHVRGKQVEIESEEPVPAQVDGDPAGYTPIHIDLLRAKVPFIVPG
jgi:YegS/Rv2252/BmrU family lipid kinase